MVVPGNEIGAIGEDNTRFIDNKKIEGTIPQMSLPMEPNLLLSVNVSIQCHLVKRVIALII
jgi:hypothetical protein